MSEGLNEKRIAPHLGALLLFSILSVIMTLPLVFHLGDSFPHGLGDPLFAAWKLDWNFQRLLNGMSGYWNANIYYPLKDTFAFADHFFGIALTALPFYLMSRSIVFAWNAGFLLTFVLSAFGAHLLALKFCKSYPAALAAAIIFAFCHYRFSHIGHLESISTHWLPFVFLFIWKFVERPSIGVALTLGVFASLQSLSSTHYALYLFLFGVPLFVTIAIALRRKLSLSFILLSLIPVALVGATLLPFVLKYASVARQFGFSRSLRDVEYYAATLRSHVSVPPYNLLLAKVLSPPPDSPVVESALFPGILASLFALLGVILVERGGFIPDMSRRFRAASKKDIFAGVGKHSRWVQLISGLVLLLAFYSLFLALGGGHILWPSAILVRWLKPGLLLFISLSCLAALTFYFPHSRHALIAWWKRKPIYIKAFAVIGATAFFLTFRTPFSVLFLAFPPLRATRVPTRLTIITMLAVSVLAAAFLAELLRKLRSARRARLIAALVLAVLLFEYSPAGLPLARLSSLTPGWASTGNDMPPVYTFLRSLPAEQPILELPMSRDTAYLYYQTYHRRPLVNGYAGFDPRPDLHRQLADFPAPQALVALRDLGTDLVVVHLWAYDPQHRKKFLQNLDAVGDAVIRIAHYGDDLVYRIRTR